MWNSCESDSSLSGEEEIETGWGRGNELSKDVMFAGV